MGRPGRPLLTWDQFLQRYWDRVDRTGDACWVWTSGTGSGGYGGVMGTQFFGPRMVAAHHVAWYLKTGELPPEDLYILHTCDDRRCVRNDEDGTYEIGEDSLIRYGHLFLGTAAHNALDKQNKGRANNGVHRSDSDWKQGYVNSGLTEDDVNRICQSVDDGSATVSQLAIQFNVHYQNIYAIMRRREKIREKGARHDDDGRSRIHPRDRSSYRRRYG